MTRHNRARAVRDHTRRALVIAHQVTGPARPTRRWPVLSNQLAHCVIDTNVRERAADLCSETLTTGIEDTHDRAAAVEIGALLLSVVSVVLKLKVAELGINGDVARLVRLNAQG